MDKNLYIKVNDREYFSTSKMIEEYPDGNIYIVTGQRSNGKTHSSLKYCLDRAFHHNETFCYIRRYDINVRTKFMQNLFTGIDLTEYGYDIDYYNGRFLAQPLEDKLSGAKIRSNPNTIVIGYAVALTTSSKYKSITFPTNLNTLLFEEYITNVEPYLSDETSLFINLISTIVRNRTEPKVILLGNSLDKRNPYTDTLGVSIKDMKKNSTKKIQSIKSNIKTTIILHRCKPNSEIIEDNSQIVTGFTSWNNTDFNKVLGEGEFESIQGYRHLAGITLNHLVKYVTEPYKPNTRILKATNVYIKYLDQYYRFYLGNLNTNYIGAFEKTTLAKSCKVLISSNPNDLSKDYLLITNLNSFNCIQPNTILYNCIVNMVNVVNQKMFITSNDDENTDIIKALREVQ